MKEDKKLQENLNHARLSLLLSNVGMRALRLLFRERYKALMNLESGDERLFEKSTMQAILKSNGFSCDDAREQIQKALDSSEPDINSWDSAFLFHVLFLGMSAGCSDDDDLVTDLKLGPTPSKRATTRRQESKNEAVTILWDVQCYLNRVPDHSLQTGDYNQWWETATGALLCLGAHEKDIQHFRSCPILAPHELTGTKVNADSQKKSKALRARAAQLVSDGKLKKGMQLYNEALLLSGLSPGEKSLLLYGRGEAFIKQMQDPKEPLSGDAISQSAMEDARLVIQLEPKGWRGYFLEGRVFQLRKRFSEAIDSFELALSLTPKNLDILIARSECTLDQSDIVSLIHADSNFTPGRLSVIFESSSKAVEKLVKANERAIVKSKDPVDKVRALTFMGHRSQLGDEAPLDVEEATDLFFRAAEEGSAEGAYYAGLNYLTGVGGVKRNIAKAVGLFEAAAHQPVRAGLESLLHNDATARAKAVVGLFFEHGVGRSRSFGRADQWLTLATIEGCAMAAMNLTRMYTEGMGIVQDLKLALQYQKLAVELGSGGAKGMHFLGHLYAELGNLPRARYWSSRAKTLGYTAPPLERQDFEELLQHKETQFQELRKRLPAHLLRSKVPIYTLYERYVWRLRPIRSAMNELTQKVLLRLHNQAATASSSAFSESLRTEPNIAEVKLAADDQEYARILLKALKHQHVGFEAINKLLSSSGDDDPPHSPKLKKLALAELAASYIAGLDRTATASMSTEFRSKLMKVTEEFVQEEDAGDRSDSDRDARVCRLNLLMEKSAEEASGLAKSCKALYPKESHFHERHAYALGVLGRHEEGVKVADEGLKLFPGNWELLYTRARHLCWFGDAPSPSEFLLEKSGGGKRKKLIPPPSASKLNSRIQAFKEFLRRAPSGHPNIPEAHYQLANLFHLSGNLPELEAQVKAGVEAEKSLLSHLLPYESFAKKVAEKSQKKVTKLQARYDTLSDQIIEKLLEREPEEIRDITSLKTTNPKRHLTTQELRQRRMSPEDPCSGTAISILGKAGFIRSRPAVVEGQQEVQQAPSPQEIPSMLSSSITFEEMDPTMEQVYRGRVLNLTIVEDYVVGYKKNPIHTAVKDDNDDFGILCLYNFDRSAPAATKKKLGYGSRIRLMNPYQVRSTKYSVPVTRIDDPDSLLFLSSVEENPICRGCLEPSPDQIICDKCKLTRCCDKDTLRREWEVVGSKKGGCKFLCKSHQH